MKGIQTSTDESNFFKECYREEPHDWVNPFDISVNDWPPPEDQSSNSNNNFFSSSSNNNEPIFYNDFEQDDGGDDDAFQMINNFAEHHQDTSSFQSSKDLLKSFGILNWKNLQTFLSLV